MDLPASPALLSTRHLTKTFLRRTGLISIGVPAPALRGVDLDISSGHTLGIVGFSGAGKSTLGRCIAGLEQPDAGEILLDDRKSDPAALRRRVQMIFQDPGASLNPRFSVADALGEPLRIRDQNYSARAIAERLNQVGLPANTAARLTPELSGGEKARLTIARALAALDAENGRGILILDESLSSLDFAVRAQVVQLLLKVQQQRELACVLIAHDLSLAARLCDRIAFLCEGRIVQQGAPRELFENPGSPELRELVAATSALERGIARVEP